MPEVLITVVIPIHNQAELLPRAIESALRQVDTDVVVVDDGSDDGTYRVAASYAELFPERVTVRRSGWSGPSHARNLGLLAARGRYVIFLDADDELATTASRCIGAYLSNCNEQPGLIVLGHTSIRPDGREIPRPRPTLPASREGRFRAYALGQISLRPSYVAFHRSVFSTISFPESIKHGEDQVVFGLALATQTCASIEEPLVRVFHYDTSLGRDIAEARRSGFACVRLLFGNPLIPEPLQRWRRHFCAKRAMSLFRHHARRGFRMRAVLYFLVGASCDLRQALLPRNLRKLSKLWRKS